ncbi:MAG: alpha/beta hydrolase [Bacteroidota bacterium]
MISPFQIDAWRMNRKAVHPRALDHPEVRMLELPGFTLRVLDTQIGAETLCIIPDGPNVIEHYVDLVERLRPHFRVLIFDLPGFGLSKHDGAYSYSFDQTNQLLLALFEATGVQQVQLAFPCANGFFGLAFASAFPDRVNRLILMQTPALSEMEGWVERIVPGSLKVPYLGQIIMSRTERKFAHKWYQYALPRGVDRAPWQASATEALEHGGHFCLCSLTQGLMTEIKSDLRLPESVPLTLLYGDKDFTHRPTDFSSIRAYHPQAEIIQLEGCGHFPDLERPEDFMGVLLNGH